MRDQITRVKGPVMLSDKTEKTIFGITGALALIGGAAALSYKAMNLLMTEAMDRHEPEAVSKMKDKLEGYVMDPELLENMHGILADCGFTSPDAIWKHVMQDNLKLLYSPQRPVIDALCKQRINMESDSWTAPESLKRAKVPVIFAHGTDDTFVPVEMTYENYKACASEKRLFIVPGADHGMSYLVDRKGYEENNLRFFRDFD